MAANKRPTRSATKKDASDRPLIRSSHGGTTTRPKKTTSARSAAAPARKPPRPLKDVKEAKEPKRSATKSASLPESRSMSGSSAASKVPSGVSTASDEAREIAVLIATAGIDKKASGLEVIDVAGRVDYADFLVLMSGRSDRHVAALSAGIEEALRKRNKRALAVEGLPHASWVLMDFGDVVVHVFQDDARAAYDIDGLWMDARRVPVPLADPRA